MTDREKARELARDWLKAFKTGIYSTDVGDAEPDIKELAHQLLALDAEHEELKEQTRWRRVEDELPEIPEKEDTRYQVCWDNYGLKRIDVFDYGTHGYFHTATRGTGITARVTHWRPLLEPPKGAEK